MKAAIYDDQEGQEDGQGDVSKDEKNVRKFPFRASYERFAKVGGPKNIDIVLFDGFDEKERRKAIEDVAKADPNNIQEVAAPTGYATSEPKGGESPEKLAKTAEKWLPERKLSRRQMLEGVEARGLIWSSHTSLGEGSVLENPL